MNTNNNAEQLALDIMTEYHPLITHSKWQEVLRTVSRMSTNPDYKSADRQTFNQSYVILKMKYHEWERHQSIGMPKSYGGGR